MLDDILDFAALSLVDDGRLSFWMPTSNEDDQDIQIPQHQCLQITSVCTQAFNRCKLMIILSLCNVNFFLKGSRRLITYRRIPDSEVVPGTVREKRVEENGVNANDLNPFRKGYFQGFKTAIR
jgi:tRNA (guanine10-N2)-methyltransferase